MRQPSSGGLTGAGGYTYALHTYPADNKVAARLPWFSSTGLSRRLALFTTRRQRSKKVGEEGQRPLEPQLQSPMGSHPPHCTSQSKMQGQPRQREEGNGPLPSRKAIKYLWRFLIHQTSFAQKT